MRPAEIAEWDTTFRAWAVTDTFVLRTHSGQSLLLAPGNT